MCGKEGTEAILCYLIQNSKNKDGDFSPLKLEMDDANPTTQRYYESFGCGAAGKGMLANLFGPKDEYWECKNPMPQKCKQYNIEVVDADKRYGEMPYDGWQMSDIMSSSLAQVSHDVGG